MRIKSLSHVGITVKDFGKAVRWYKEVFNFPLIAEMDMGAEDLSRLKTLYKLKEGVSVKLGFLRTPKGGVIEIFNFSETAPFDHAWNRPGTHHFTLDASGVKKWHKKLSQRKDIEILCEPQFSGGSDWFFFRDPDGNLIELIDLKFNYFAIRRLAGLLAPIMAKTKFKKYYY